MKDQERSNQGQLFPLIVDLTVNIGDNVKIIYTHMVIEFIRLDNRIFTSHADFSIPDSNLLPPSHMSNALPA